MRLQVQALRELQEEDRKIHELQKLRDQIPTRVQELRGHLETIRTIVERERVQLREAERFRRERELEAKSQQEALQASKSKLARNTKEYSLLQREYDSLKKSQQEQEEEILKLMQVIEESKKSIAAHEAELQQLSDEVAAEEKQGQEKIAVLDAQIATLRQATTQISSRVSRNVLARYNQILSRRKDGVAVIGARAGACMGCHMNLPAQLFNIIIKGDTLETCPSCVRILYFSPAEPEPQANKA